jgi:competence protein ComEC
MPLVWICLVFILGIVTAEVVSLSLPAWLVVGVGLVVFWGAGMFVRRALNRQPVLAQRLARLENALHGAPLWVLLLVFWLGALRYQAAQPVLNPEFIAWYNDTSTVYVLEGVIQEPPDARDSSTLLRVQVTRLRPEQELLFSPVNGLLLATVYAPGDWSYGDKVRLEGRLETPPGGETFSYRDYLARQGVYSQMRAPQVNVIGHGEGNPLPAVLYAFRANALDVVYRLWPDPEASLLAGILLGVESGIPPAVQEAFLATGTSHIIVISGFNITIVAGLFAALFGRMLGRWRGALAALLGIGAYTILVGGDAAVMRAAILGGLGLFAAQIGRRQAGVNSLVLAGAVMALINPHVLWDVGFQLSFAATLGMILYAEPLTRGFVRLAETRLSPAAVSRLSGPVSEYFLVTLAAQVTTLPIILYYFQRLSLSALLANPLILPAQPPVMVLGGLAVFLGSVFLPLGRLVAPIVYPFVLYTVRLVEWFADVFGPGLSLGAVALPLVIGFYTLLLGLTWLVPRGLPEVWKNRVKEWFGNRLTPLQGISLALLLILVVLTWRAGFAAPDGRLHVTLLDVGAGEALLLTTPGGRQVLVNGGSSPSRLSDGLGRRLPPFNRQLDYLVVGAPGAEQVAALADNLPRFTPAAILWAGPTHGERESRFLQQAIAQMDIPLHSAAAGQILDLGSGAELEVLAVGERGAAFLLTYGSFRMLLPAGINFEMLETLRKDPRLADVTAVLLADSGYGPSNPPEWLAALNPQLVLISVAADDYEGRPDPAVLQALEGRTLLRTDRNGWIELSTDGEQMWVEAERR